MDFIFYRYNKNKRVNAHRPPKIKAGSNTVKQYLEWNTYCKANMIGFLKSPSLLCHWTEQTGLLKVGLERFVPSHSPPGSESQSKLPIFLIVNSLFLPFVAPKSCSCTSPSQSFSLIRFLQKQLVRKLRKSGLAHK